MENLIQNPTIGLQHEDTSFENRCPFCVTYVSIWET